MQLVGKVGSSGSKLPNSYVIPNSYQWALNEIGPQSQRLVCFHKWSDWSIYPGWGGKMVRECTKCGKREYKVAKAGR